MPKGNATAQAYRVELKDGKPAFIYNVNDKSQFDKAWNEARAAK